MNIIKEDLDSIAFGQNVLKINDVDIKNDFSCFEEDYIRQYKPIYVYSKIEIEDFDKIHYLEKNGFEFAEAQLKMTKRLSEIYDTSMFDNHYEFVEVTDKKDLPRIMQMSDKIFNVDRIYLDNNFDKSISQKRYHLYIEKSFHSENERILKLVDTNTSEIIGFSSHMLLGDDSILLFLGGILPEYQNSGLAFLQEYLGLNMFLKEGRKKITTHISLSNYKIMNFLSRTLRYKPRQTYVILRKVYE